VEAAFEELARRWRPILDVCDEQGVNLCFEIHPAEDLHDGTSFERFHALVGEHERCRILFDPSHFVLQQLDYLAYLDLYHPLIRMFHVKDAEFNRAAGRVSMAATATGPSAPGASARWAMGRSISRRSSPSWRSTTSMAGPPLSGSAASRTRRSGPEGVEFIDRHIIQVTGQVFDDFAGAPLALGRSSACWGLPRRATQWEHGHEPSHRVQDDAFAHVYVQVEGLRIHCAVAGRASPCCWCPAGHRPGVCLACCLRWPRKASRRLPSTRPAW
jgi:hypothetical protein